MKRRGGKCMKRDKVRRKSSFGYKRNETKRKEEGDGESYGE